MDLAHESAFLRERGVVARLCGQYALSDLYYDLAEALQDTSPETARDALRRGLMAIARERR